MYAGILLTLCPILPWLHISSSHAIALDQDVPLASANRATRGIQPDISSLYIQSPDRLLIHQGRNDRIIEWFLSPHSQLPIAWPRYRILHRTFDRQKQSHASCGNSSIVLRSCGTMNESMVSVADVAIMLRAGAWMLVQSDHTLPHRWS